MDPNRKPTLLGDAGPGTAILEIGPSYNPVAPRAGGWNTTIVDHAPTEELREKYVAIGIDVSALEAVDHVWTGGRLEDCIPAGRHGTFQRLIASHVIEHIPDLLGFLRSAERLLTRDGAVALAVPDKRYCFDYFRPPTTTADLIAAQGAVRHSRRSIFAQYAYSVTVDHMQAFGQHPVATAPLAGSLEEARDMLARQSDSADSPYLDAHAWQFTPAWFELAIIELAELGLADWHVAAIQPPIYCEFIATLRRGRAVWESRAARDARRHALLLRTLEETQEQLGYAIAGGLVPPIVGAGLVPQRSGWAVGVAPMPPAVTPGPAMDGVHPLARRLHHLLSGGGNRWFGPAPQAALPGLEALGTVFPAYRAIVPRQSRYLDAVQEGIAALPVDGVLIQDRVKGHLRVADALALYEIAYLAEGDVLDVGTAWGLSASVMARALESRGGAGRVVSVETDAGLLGHAVAAMARLGLAGRFSGMLGDAAAVLPRLAARGRRFGAAFIDHDHRHPAQAAALAAVAELLVPGGWVLVHDFNDPNNAADPGEFGIHRAVAEAVARGPLAFAGVVGCCALLRKVG